MIKIGTFQDDILDNEFYDLYSCKLSEIKKLVLDSIQTKGPFNAADYDKGQQSQHAVEYEKIRIPSFYHNNFIVVQGLGDGLPWLVDGFTRLFITSEYVEDINVFVKSYSKSMSDDIVMKLLASLNFWKCAAYHTNTMFDRGFTLYTYMKTGYNVKKHIDEISFYLDVRTLENYNYDFHYNVRIQKDLLLKNPNIFSDIITLSKLSDNIFNAHLKNKPGYDRGNKDIPFAIPFYQIVGALRIINMSENANYTIDIKDASEWIQNNQELRQLAIDNALSHNTTSDASTRTKSKELFWNKYILPTVLKREVEKTSEEKKEDFRKMVSKEKNKYKKMNYMELKDAQPGLEVFSFYVNYPTMKITKKIYKGLKSETETYVPKIGLMKDRIQRVTEYNTFMFENEKGIIEENQIQKNHDYAYKERFELVLKTKK